jgi:hypothetical protein
MLFIIGGYSFGKGAMLALGERRRAGLPSYQTLVSAYRSAKLANSRHNQRAARESTFKQPALLKGELNRTVAHCILISAVCNGRSQPGLQRWWLPRAG